MLLVVTVFSCISVPKMYENYAAKHAHYAELKISSGLKFAYAQPAQCLMYMLQYDTI